MGLVTYSRFLRLASCGSALNSGCAPRFVAAPHYAHGQKGKYMNQAARFITIRQFMQRYQVSRSTTYRLINAGMIITAKIGRAVRIPVQSAESWARGVTIANDNEG